MDNTSQPEQIEILLKNIEWYKKLVREKEQRIKELEVENLELQKKIMDFEFDDPHLKRKVSLIEENKRLRENYKGLLWDIQRGRKGYAGDHMVYADCLFEVNRIDREAKALEE